MPRRRSQTFEFTGTEALDAEKAAATRVASHTRPIKPKRSIITIPPSPSHANSPVDVLQPTSKHLDAPSILPSPTPDRVAPPSPPTLTPRALSSPPAHRPVKRVRFTDPLPVPTLCDSTGLLNVMKLHRKRNPSPHDPVPSLDEVSDENTQQLLLDELQYAMDGILHSRHNSRTANQLTIPSLLGLISLLLRKPTRRSKLAPLPKQPANTLLLSILARQPHLLTAIINSLFTLLGHSKHVDLLLSLTFLIIFRSTSNPLLQPDHLDLLLNAFFRNSAVSLKEHEARSRGLPQSPPPSQPRPRGRLAPRLDSSNNPQTKHLLQKVNSFLKDAAILDHSFSNEPDGSAYLIASALTALIFRQPSLRNAMRQNRRLDKVVAVLYSAEQIMFSKPNHNHHHFSPSVIVTGAAIRVLEIVTLDPVCQRRISTESRVIDVVLSVIHAVKRVDITKPEIELFITAALRLCMNLTHACPEGSSRFSKANGIQVVIDCLAKEARNAHLVAPLLHDDECVDSFDIRVLCLALLTSMTDQDDALREQFCKIDAKGVPSREGGALALVLELLKSAGKTVEEEEEDGERVDERVGRKRPHVLGRLEEMDGQGHELLGSTMAMERKVTIGYLCLLIGALVRKSETNRELVRAALPDHSLRGVAGVLEEFLEFHREIGLTAGPIESLYQPIVRSLLDIAVEEDTIQGSG